MACACPVKKAEEVSDQDRCYDCPNKTPAGVEEDYMFWLHFHAQH